MKVSKVDCEYLTEEQIRKAKAQYKAYFKRNDKKKKVDGQIKCDILIDEGRVHGNAKDFLNFKRAKIAAQKDR